jgi:hypothetical protein
MSASASNQYIASTAMFRFLYQQMKGRQPDNYHNSKLHRTRYFLDPDFPFPAAEFHC